MKFLFLGVPASPSAPPRLCAVEDAEANCQIDTSPLDFSAQAAASDEVRIDAGAFNGSCFCLKAAEGEGARD